MAQKKAKAAAEPTPAPTPAPERDWTHAGEDYEPTDIGIPGFEVADEAFLSQVLADAQQAVTEKKNAKQVFEVLMESIKVAKNLFRPV